MKREFIILLTSLMLIGLLGTASMSLGAGAWTQKADMPTARFIPGSAVVDGKIYVIGGAPVSMGHTAVVEEYDPATDTWTRRSDMPTARQGVIAAAVDGIIYAIGGCSVDVDRDLPTVEAYDATANMWTTKTDMPTARTQPAVAVVDGIIYVIGGVLDRVVLSAVEAYDPATDTWTKKTDMPMAIFQPGTCVVDRRIYVSGGKTKWGEISSYLPTVEVYDPATDTWTQTFDMPRGRYGHSASVVAGKMHFIGGADPETIKLIMEGKLDGDKAVGEFLAVDVYDLATDTWTTAADSPTPRWLHTAAVMDGKIYIIGGWVGPPESATILSIVAEYDPGLP